MRERLVERRTRDLASRGDELRELGSRHRLGCDPGGDELVRKHVRRFLRVGARVDNRCPEPVEPAGHEHVRVVERERVGDAADPRAGQLADLAAQPLDEVVRRVHGDEVGLREVAVVLRLFLGAHRRRLLVARVEVERLLVDRAAGLVDLDLPRDLALDPLRREVERVHVLQLRARAQLVGAGRADGDVDVEAHRSLVELGVGQLQLDDGLAQQLQEALGRLGVVQVGLGHDLDERCAAAVEVDERGGGAVQPPGLGDVDVLRRILLEVGARDADRDAAVVARHDELPARAERLVVLADLVRLRQVGIEVVLAVEHGALGDLAVEREPELDRLLDRAPVRHRQRAREGEADRADVRVRRIAVASCGSGRTSSSSSSAARGSRARSPAPRSSRSSQPLRDDVEAERALERVPDAEERVLGELRADQLQADRQTLREAARDAEPRQARHARRDRQAGR